MFFFLFIYFFLYGTNTAELLMHFTNRNFIFRGKCQIATENANWSKEETVSSLLVQRIHSEKLDTRQYNTRMSNATAFI